MNQSATSERKHLLLVGGGHAHLRLINRIPEFTARGIDVTVLDSNTELYYSGMMPAVLGGLVSPSAARIPVAEIVSRGGGRFVEHAASRIDAVRRVVETAAGEFPWHVASIAIGSRVQPPIPVAPGAVVLGAKPVGQLPELFSTVVRKLEAHRDRPVRVVFIGGGASAVELAGNLAGRMERSRREHQERLELTIVSRGAALVPRMAQKVQQIAQASLRGRGVRLHMNSVPRAVSTTAVEMEHGEALPADITVFCTGLSAPEVISSSGLPHSADGTLLVADTLRMNGAPLYGGGDCVGIEGLKLERIGVHAVRQSGVLLHNVSRELAGASPPTLQRYVPPEAPMLILNLGDGTGILVQGARVMHGRLPYRLKERIDWAFVRSGGMKIRPTLLGPPRP